MNKSGAERRRGGTRSCEGTVKERRKWMVVMIEGTAILKRRQKMVKEGTL